MVLEKIGAHYELWGNRWRTLLSPSDLPSQLLAEIREPFRDMFEPGTVLFPPVSAHHDAEDLDVETHDFPPVTQTSGDSASVYSEGDFDDMREISGADGTAGCVCEGDFERDGLLVEKLRDRLAAEVAGKEGNKPPPAEEGKKPSPAEEGKKPPPAGGGKKAPSQLMWPTQGEEPLCE